MLWWGGWCVVYSVFIVGVCLALLVLSFPLLVLLSFWVSLGKGSMIFIALFITIAFWWFLLFYLVSFLLEFLSLTLVCWCLFLVFCWWLEFAYVLVWVVLFSFYILVLFYCCLISVLVLELSSFEWSSNLQIIEKKKDKDA